ncbi:MAG: TrmB family transcriptional regulator [Candidatus Heimdallarchaeota archaeon]|nr:TrmB family transcriptional regulator [Candidatus Heimdallarchaeota archaeon]
MSFIDEAVEKLKEIGWSEYESKTYSALVSLGRTTASQIAKVSQVPPNRVYQILDKLKEKNYVEDVQPTRGGPRTFSPKDPQALFGEIKIEFTAKIDSAQFELEKLKERVDEKPNLSTFTIVGRKELNNYLKDAINRASSSIYLAVDTLVELKYADIIPLLKSKASIDEFNLKLLTMPRGIDNVYEKEIADELIKLELNVAEDPFGTILLVVDDETSIFINYGVHDDIKDILSRNLSSDQLDKVYLEREKNYVGFFILDEKIASLYTQIFNNAWDGSQSYETYNEEEERRLGSSSS